MSRKGAGKLLAAYCRAVDHNNTSDNDRKEIPFYRDVEDIVGGNPAVSPTVVISSSDGLTRRQKQPAAKRKINGIL